MSRVLIAAGGTGGHTYPALATAEVLRARGHDVVFVGGSRIEARIVPAAGFEFFQLPARSLPRKPSLGAIVSGVAFARSLMSARRLIKRLGPEVVLGLGGYVSAAPGWAATQAGVPVVLHEQNARLSLGNRMVLRRARALALSLPCDDEIPAGVEVVTTGNPLRPAIIEVATDPDARRRARERASARFELAAGRPTVLVFGGSLGSAPINDAVAIAAAGWDAAQILHLTGTGNEAHKRAVSANHTVLAYLEEMEEAFSAADVVVSRSGASTVAELTAFGLPSVLVPLPHAPRGAQEANARALERNGAARVVIQGPDLAARLRSEVDDLLSDEYKRRSMGDAAAKMAIPDAAMRLANLVESAI